MKSITYGNINNEQMYDIINDYINRDKNSKFDITIGTDSQNFDKTKTIMVVAVHNVGKGGIFFYDTLYVNRITNIKQKIFFETTQSLNFAMELLDNLNPQYQNFKVAIHVDAGYNGPTSKVIPEITSWVKACGFACCTKPYSYTASSIANKFSK